MKGLRMLTHNIKMNNICPMISLKKHWTRLKLNTTVDGKVGVKTIAKTFASGTNKRQKSKTSLISRLYILIKDTRKQAYSFLQQVTVKNNSKNFIIELGQGIQFL